MDEGGQATLALGAGPNYCLYNAGICLNDSDSMLENGAGTLTSTMVNSICCKSNINFMFYTVFYSK